MISKGRTLYVYS